MKNIFIILCVFLSSCKRDDSDIVFSLPEKTQSGKNTFGFLLNSLVWTNYGTPCDLSGCNENVRAIYFRSDGDISISVSRIIFNNNQRTTSEGFYISMKTKFGGERTYNTVSGDTIYVSLNNNLSTPIDSPYITSPLNPKFQVRITKLDTINKILSGEFSGTLFKRNLFNGVATSLTDSINIKEGRFDIKLN
jgi:hypothetical protein